jgi:hypothetical protein
LEAMKAKGVPPGGSCCPMVSSLRPAHIPGS